MVTSSQTPPVTELFDEPNLPSAPPVQTGVGKRLFHIVVALGLITGVVALGAYGSTRWIGGASREQGPVVLTHPVARGELVVTVIEDGNVESASNIDIKCEVAGGSSILWIVDDGSLVKKGEKLVELDQSVIEDQINQQKITFEKARSSMIQAEKDYEVAQITVKEFLEGTFKQQQQDQQAQITIAEENLRTAQNSLQHTQRMFRKGYVSQLELEGQQFSVQRAQLELDSARTAKNVLEQFTKVKTMEDLQSKVETAQAKMESEKAALALEEARLKKLQAQMDSCVIVAPQDGMVVYANEQSMGRFGSQQGVQIEEGATVRERQTILRLPDLSQMQVKVNVHETKVEKLARDMRARIVIQGKDFQGSVASIANQPEPTSFFSATVKEYATIVRIDGEAQGLRPGMTAEVEILVAHLKDVLTLPVAAIVEQRGAFFCWVKKGAGREVERRPLVLGMSNDQFVEIQDGVGEGDQVLLNPRASVREARTDNGKGPETDVQKKFGEQSNAAPAADGGPKGGPPGTGNGPPGRAGMGSPAPTGGEPRQPGQGPPAGPGGRSGRGPGGGMGDLMAADKDGDGKVSKDEAPEFLQNFFDRVDTNTDGFLDKAEIEAMRNRRGPGGSGGGPRDLMQYDANGDGKVTKEEAPEQMRGFFDRMDPNGDGAIDREEIESMRARFGGGGPGGPGGGGGFGRPPE
jgi:HlyD family secretion protein